jgi:hypothetical protein
MQFQFFKFAEVILNALGVHRMGVSRRTRFQSLAEALVIWGQLVGESNKKQ